MSAAEPPRRLALALQGGGAHGAFTWGVLDALLGEPRIEIAALTGASAGALNAVAVADGLMAGGRAGARAKLEEAWRTMSAIRAFSPVQATVPTKLGYPSLDVSPAYWLYNLTSRIFSPYEFNPLDVNQLREAVRGLFDYERLKSSPVPVHIAATEVLTGRARLFRHDEITPEALAASGGLPTIFQAVRVDGAEYWDGGYSANPPLEPLTAGDADARGFEDVLIVQLTPTRRATAPRGRRDIEERTDEIAFNMNLLRQVDGLRRLAALADSGDLAPRHRPPFLHRLHGDEVLEPLSTSSKVNAEWAYLTPLRDAGRAKGRAWIEAHLPDLGRRDTIDLPPPLL